VVDILRTHLLAQLRRHDQHIGYLQYDRILGTNTATS